jgi:hypothetical protein
MPTWYLGLCSCSLSQSYKGGEHTCDLLMVSVSISIQNCEMMGSTPGFYRNATPGVTEFRQFHLTMPRRRRISALTVVRAFSVHEERLLMTLPYLTSLQPQPFTTFFSQRYHVNIVSSSAHFESRYQASPHALHEVLVKKLTVSSINLSITPNSDPLTMGFALKLVALVGLILCVLTILSR